jgi:hypothetical protein
LKWINKEEVPNTRPGGDYFPDDATHDERPLPGRRPQPREAGQERLDRRIVQVSGKVNLNGLKIRRPPESVVMPERQRGS